MLLHENRKRIEHLEISSRERFCKAEEARLSTEFQMKFDAKHNKLDERLEVQVNEIVTLLKSRFNTVKPIKPVGFTFQSMI
jgi:predicted amidohydrolase YtcJ